MPPARFASSSKPPLGRHLVFAEREEIALLRAQGHGVRAIARRLARHPSTISRELRRNAATRSGGLEYRATTAQWDAERSARRPKPTKLALNVTLRTDVGSVASADGGQAKAEHGRRLRGCAEQGSNEVALSAHVIRWCTLDLCLTDHRHCLITCNRPGGRHEALE